MMATTRSILAVAALLVIGLAPTGGTAAESGVALCAPTAAELALGGLPLGEATRHMLLEGRRQRVVHPPEDGFVTNALALARDAGELATSKLLDYDETLVETCIAERNLAATFDELADALVWGIDAPVALGDFALETRIEIRVTQTTTQRVSLDRDVATAVILLGGVENVEDALDYHREQHVQREVNVRTSIASATVESGEPGGHVEPVSPPAMFG